MENDIIARAEQLGHEADGLHYFYYDTILSNPIIVEEVLGEYDRIEHYNKEGETVYLVFKDDKSKIQPAYELSYIEKLLSGEVIETQAHCICRDRAKLVALLKKEWDDELRRKQLETIANKDWEGRIWQLACDMYIRRRGDVFEDALMEATINEAKLFIEQYKNTILCQ